MGIETGERESLVPGGKQNDDECADSRLLLSPATRKPSDAGRKLHGGDGEKEEASDDDPDMSIFTEKQPRDVLHLETVYISGDEELSQDDQSLLHEQLCEELDISKALRRQNETLHGPVNLRHLHNLQQQWTFSSRDKEAFLNVTEFTENTLLEAEVVVDSNGNIQHGPSGVADRCSSDRQNKNVFVRRGDSAAWRVWQEILGENQPQRKLHARYETDNPVVMCFPCRLSLYLSIEGNALNHRTKVYVEARDKNDDLLLNGPFISQQNRIDLEFTATVKGPATVSLKCIGPKSAEVIPYDLKVDIGGNNPLMSFSDDCSWPVAVSYDAENRLLYVAYDNYIIQYYEEGELVEYSKQLSRLDDGHYNDMTLSRAGDILVASFSGWKTQSLKYRYQAIHMYATATGELLQSMDNEYPLFYFESPILHIATKDEETILVADRASICECSLHTGMITARLSTEGMGSVSRIAFSRDRYFVADAKTGCVKIYDLLGTLEKSFQVTTSGGEAVVGMTGLAVDHRDNIIVSDCLSGTINAYTSDGTLFCSIDSDWDMVQWPLHLTTTPDGHVFVVDHRNGCVKKFKYM